MCTSLMKQSKTTANHKVREQEKRKETEMNYKNILKTMKKMTITRYLPIITLNVNGLNSPIKRHTVAQWIKRTKPIYMLPIRDPVWI